MYMLQNQNMKKIWDTLGILVSATCALHCFAVGMLPFALPFFDSFFHSALFHIVFIAMVIIITPMAFKNHFKRHGFSFTIKLALIGVMLILTGAGLEPVASEALSHGVSILGSFAIVSAHIMNLRHYRKHKHC